MTEPKSPRTLIAENLASLNEIIAELVVHVADPEESEFVELVRNTLRDHSWSIGMAFQGEMPSAEWQRKQWLSVVEDVKRKLPAGMAFQDGPECTGANDGTCPKHPEVSCETDD